MLVAPMKKLQMALLAAWLCACSEPDGTQQVDVSASEKPRKPRTSQEDAGKAAAGNDAKPAGANDGSEPEAATTDDAEPEATTPNDHSQPSGDDVGVAGPEPEMEEDTVDFGGGGVDVVVEPSAEPAAPDDDPGDDAADDDPADDDPRDDEDDSRDEPAEPPLVSCAGVMGAGDGSLIDDFEDVNLDTLVQDERDGSWFYYDDDTGGSHSVLIDPLADTRSGYGLHISGGDFSEWGSGVGVGLRWTATGEERCVYDASYYTGLRFWIRGNGATVRVQAMNPIVIPEVEGGACADPDACWDNHGVDVESEADWTEVFLPFSEFAQRWTEPPVAFDAASIFTIEFTFESYVDYDIWIDDLGFYREGEELPPYSPNLETE